MKKTKLIITVVFLIVLATFLFAGCSAPVKTKKMFAEKNLVARKNAVDSVGKNAKNLVDGNTFSSYKLDSNTFVDIDFGGETTFNTIVLKEKTDVVHRFRFYGLVGEEWQMLYEQDQIGALRICYIGDTTATKLRLHILESTAKAKISEMQVFNQAKKDTEFRVVDYCRMDYDKTTDKNEIVELKDDPGFTGYFNVITDIIAFDSVYIDAEGKLKYNNGEENFAKSLDALKYIINNSGKKVNIWCTVLFSYMSNPKSEYNQKQKEVAEILTTKRDNINAEIKAMVKKYEIYGIDYDWEMPQTYSQWRVYDNLVMDTAEFAKVSVAIPPWGATFSKKVREKLDHVNVMAYDLFDKRGNHSNMFIAGYDAAYKILAKGYSPKQVILGVPTYGRTTNESGNAWPVYNGNPQLGKWGNIVRDFEYNEILPDGKIVKMKADGYLNGYAMIRDKTLTAVDMSLGGVMVFRTKCDAPYTYELSLHRAIEEVINSRIRK